MNTSVEKWLELELVELKSALGILKDSCYNIRDLDCIKKSNYESRLELLEKEFYVIDDDLLHYSVIDSKLVQRAFYAYTDGSAVVRGKSKGNGGFGTYFPNLFGSKKAWSLGFEDTKTGRMEISALFYAIKAMPERLKYSVTLRVYSDSEYVVKSFTEKRLEKWIKNGWRNSSGEVKNIDLWKEVLEALDRRKYLRLDMKHIRSHQVEREKDPIKKAKLLKNPHIIGNLMADKLADYKRHKILLTSDKL